MEYVSKHKPWSHQQTALDKMEPHRVFGLLMAMRTGKTKVTFDRFGQLHYRNEADDLLIIAPAGVYETWLDQARDHLHPDLFDAMRFYIVAASKERGKKRKLHREAFMEWRNGPRMLVVNVEALSTVKLVQEIVLAFVNQRTHRCMVAVDESTSIKNVDSGRGGFVDKFLGPLDTWKLILSGLLTPRSPLDLYGQFHWMNWRILGCRSIHGFKTKHAITQTIPVGPPRDPDSDVDTRRMIKMIVGYRGEEELRDRIAPYTYRCRLEDCYDMPEKVYQPRYIEMTDEQKKLYEDMKRYSTAELAGQHITASAVIVRMMRLHQILCGWSTTETGERVFFKENKTPQMMNLLEEYEGKAIIWCSYKENIITVSNALKEAYGEASVAHFWGGNKNTREAEEKVFQNDQRCRFMIATPDAGGKGRMWAAADLVIYHSSRDNLEHRAQSEERAQAVGKKQFTSYVDLIHRNTVEEKIIGSLRKKLTMSSLINGDNYQEWLI